MKRVVPVTGPWTQPFGTWTILEISSFILTKSFNDMHNLQGDHTLFKLFDKYPEPLIKCSGQWHTPCRHFSMENFCIQAVFHIVLLLIC